MSGHAFAHGHRHGHRHGHKHSRGNPNLHLSNILESVSAKALAADILRICDSVGIRAPRVNNEPSTESMEFVDQMEEGVHDYLLSKGADSPLILTEERLEQILEQIPTALAKRYKAEIQALLNNTVGRKYAEGLEARHGPKESTQAQPGSQTLQEEGPAIRKPRRDLGFLDRTIDEIAKETGLSAESLSTAQQVIWRHVNPPGFVTADKFQYRHVVARSFFGKQPPDVDTFDGFHGQWLARVRSEFERQLGERAPEAFRCLVELTRYNFARTSAHEGGRAPRGVSAAGQIRRLLKIDPELAQAVAELQRGLPEGPTDRRLFWHQHIRDPKNFPAVKLHLAGGYYRAQRKGLVPELEAILKTPALQAFRSLGQQAALPQRSETADPAGVEADAKALNDWRKEQAAIAAAEFARTEDFDAYDAEIDRIMQTENLILGASAGDAGNGAQPTAIDQPADEMRKLARWVDRLIGAYEAKIHLAAPLAEALANTQLEFLRTGDAKTKRELSGAALARKLGLEERRVQRHLETLVIELEDGRRYLAEDLLCYSDKKERWLPVIKDLLESPQLPELLEQHASHPESGPTPKAIWEILAHCPDFGMAMRSFDGSLHAEISERTVRSYIGMLQRGASVR